MAYGFGRDICRRVIIVRKSRAGDDASYLVETKAVAFVIGGFGVRLRYGFPACWREGDDTLTTNFRFRRVPVPTLL